MDGASKFVRGDAVAGLIITFINVIAGIIIGVVQKNLSFTEATQSYTLLTVGDGLVSQIPALIVSTAAGMLVTKAGVSGSADKALFGQLERLPLGARHGLVPDAGAGDPAGHSGAAVPRARRADRRRRLAAHDKPRAHRQPKP